MSKTNRQILEFQADCIEAVLEQHQVRARVTGGLVAPRWIQFQVLPGLGERVNRVKGLAEELALALDADTCRVTRRRGTVAVEIPRPDPQPVRLLPLQRRLAERREIPFGAAVLGLDEDGAPLLVRLPSPQVAHLFVAGTTGSGKSALAQTIVASLALSHRPSQLGFVLIDPKRRAFGPLAGLPHLLRPVLSEPEEIDQALRVLVQLMLTRDREGRLPATGNDAGEPRVVVVIDELADLLMMTGKESQRALTRLAQRGREAGVHLVACTQKPTCQLVGSLVKANFPIRLVGRVTSPEDAKVATGYGGTGAEHLRGPGDFVAVNGGQVTRFQAAFISKQELADLVGQMVTVGHPAAIEMPALDVPAPSAPTGKLAAYVERARPVWRRVRKAGGGLRRGGKADLAEAIFEDRSTAGHQGRWVERVVQALEETDEELDDEEPVSRHCLALPLRLRTESQKRFVQRKTRLSRMIFTTTTRVTRALLRARGSDEAFEVVVVVYRAPNGR